MEFDSPYQSYEYMAKMEQYFREKIAKEIEAMPDPKTNIGDVIVGYMSARNQAAAIARGTSPRSK